MIGKNNERQHQEAMEVGVDDVEPGALGKILDRFPELRSALENTSELARRSVHATLLAATLLGAAGDWDNKANAAEAGSIDSDTNISQANEHIPGDSEYADWLTRGGDLKDPSSPPTFSGTPEAGGGDTGMSEAEARAYAERSGLPIVEEAGPDDVSETERDQIADPRLEKLVSGYENLTADTESRIAEILTSFQNTLDSLGTPDDSMVRDILAGELRGVDGYTETFERIKAEAASAMNEMSQQYTEFQEEHGLSLSEIQNKMMENPRLGDMRQAQADALDQQFGIYRDELATLEAESKSKLGKLISNWAGV